MRHVNDVENVALRQSVAELAGRFKASAPPPDAAGNKADTPLRRRPPRSLELPEIHRDVQQSSGVTTTLPTKAKRNSALIEKLQANLALSPSALIPSPKSPGFRTPLPSTIAMVTTSSSTVPASPVSLITAVPLTMEESPTSFEAPPTAVEGSILSNMNKGRARLSVRRRPPSRHHRKSSSGDDVGVDNDETDMPPCSPAKPDSKVEGGGAEEDGDEDIFISNGFLRLKSKMEKDKPEEEDQSKANVQPPGGAEEMESSLVQTQEDDPGPTVTGPTEDMTNKLRS
ncbi:duboraya isoform X2 [Thalassophryne amazonica]|uniref:duboraya isoform X1 n=1 Tax=Thalassophryne amazonica TaxID=390379 RepID=UPI0014708FA6|nr:duboraya isoform X1 [Thalassophryne amazonica]XP_034033478.1 duboraya isoform X2 [Thalassophryne amazonica]